MFMSIIVPFRSQCDRNWKKVSTIFILHQGWFHNSGTIPRVKCCNYIVPLLFFNSFFYLFDVSWIKAFVEERTRKHGWKTRSKAIVMGLALIGSMYNQMHRWHITLLDTTSPPNLWQKHLQVATKTSPGCLFRRLCSPLVLPCPSTCTPTTPLLISQEHSGGKAFHLLNKVEGCHNTGA